MMALLNGWYLRQVATWAAMLKRTDLAIESWDRLAALRPADPTPLAAAAHLHAGAGRRERAIALLQQAVALDPRMSLGWFNLGFLIQEEGRHEEALTAFRKATSLDPKLDRAWYGMALSLIKLNRLADAVGPLEKNIDLQPMSPYGYYQLAHVHAKLGDAGKAEKVIKRLLRFEPKVAQLAARETGVTIDPKLLPSAPGFRS